MNDESGWQPARIIPTSGIQGQEEAERRASSALLAVLGAVREFGSAVLRPLGAPSGAMATFIEVPFKTGDTTVRPDGLIRVTRGARSWTALVEVKTGAGELLTPQIEAYLDIAREQNFDVVLTISNQIAPAPGAHPTDVDGRKTRRVALHHRSWAEILTLAVRQRAFRGVSDPDQAWILGELIRYLEHPRSGALDFTDMGGAWVSVRESVASGTLRAGDKGLAEVVSRWEQLLRFASLRLGRELGADVQVSVSRKEAADPAAHFATQARSLVQNGTLTGTLRIPDSAAPIDVVADLRAGRVIVSASIDAPRDGRPATRINWLVRQLRDAPDLLRIDAFTLSSRTSTSELLRHVRENPSVLIADSKRELRAFRIAASSPVGTKRGTGRGCFIDSVLSAIDGFYEIVIQNLRPWTAKAPQIAPSGRTAVEDAGIDIRPPESDLEEPPLAESEAIREPREPEAVVEGVTRPEVEHPNGHDVPEPVLAEFVSWDDAQARLDHERSTTEQPDPR